MNYLYAPQSIADRKRIFRDFAGVIGDESRLEMFNGIDALSARLQRFNNTEILVLLAVGKNDMPEILSFRHIVSDAAVILLLCDQDPDTIAAAHLLRPRFLGTIDGDLDKIIPVVKKLFQKRKNGQSRYAAAARD
jgi:hypothetical protein